MRTLIRTTIAALSVTLGLVGFLIAQAPPAIPALPDTTRVTTYSVSGTTCACSVGFNLYGDGTDVDQWIQVYVGGVAKLSTDPSAGWVLTSATGSLGTIPRPITDAVLTFNAVQTATVNIVGAQRPRRLTQFAENRGIPARDHNQALTTLFAEMREQWDVDKRSITGQPGDVLTPLPAAATRAGTYLGFDVSGQPALLSPLTGSGNVSGPATSTNNHIAVFAGTTGKVIADGGSLGTGDVVGPAGATGGHFATFNGATGKLIQDGGAVGALATASTINASLLANSAAAFGINMLNGTIVPSNNGTALTLAVKTLAAADPSASDPVFFVFRSATVSSGSYTVIQVTAALSVTIPANSTLGTANATPFRIWLGALNNAGTVELTVINCLSGTNIFPLTSWGINSTTAFGGGANNAQTLYSTNSRASVPISVLGYFSYETGSTLATAGTWNANPTRVELYRPGVPLPGAEVQRVRTATGAVATGTTTVSAWGTDNVPTSAMGDNYAGLSTSITPASSANILSIDVQGLFFNSAASRTGMMLLQDATANSLVAVYETIATSPLILRLNHEMLAATLSSTTFKINAGGGAAGTTTFNGSSGSRDLGGKNNSFMLVREIMG